MAVKTSVKKTMNLRSFNLIPSIWTRSIYQKQATFPGFEFLRILFRFKKRKENSSSYVHVHRKTANWKVSRRSRAVDVEEMYFKSRRCGRRRSCLSSQMLRVADVK